MKLKDRFIRFMYGRYGVDSFGKFTIWGSLILMLIAGWTHRGILSWLAWAGIIYSYFRMFSKNTYKRAAENQKYLQMTRGIRTFFYRQRNMITQRKTHHIYKVRHANRRFVFQKEKARLRSAARSVTPDLSNEAKEFPCLVIFLSTKPR